MKIKLNKLFYWSILLQILATQGVVTFLIFDFFGNWQLKKFIHPFSFLLIVLLIIRNYLIFFFGILNMRNTRVLNFYRDN